MSGIRIGNATKDRTTLGQSKHAQPVVGLTRDYTR